MTGTSYTDTGLSATTLYFYKVTPGNGNGAGTGATVSSLGTGVPAPWRTQDIGSNIPGGASAASGAFTLYGNGGSGHGTPFRYVYQTLPGDGAITVRLTSLTNTADARAGVMIRDSLDADSRYVYLNLHATSSGNNLNLEYRQTKGAAPSWGNEYTSAQPCWLRLVRFGATTALYTSSDGAAWSQYATVSFALNTTVCIGMAANGGDAGAIGTATFDNVAVTVSVVGGGTATANSDDGQGRVAANAFDGNISTKWNEPQTPTGFLQYQFAGGASKAVSQYQLICSEDSNRPARDPATWQFQGSNDGAAWTTLDTQTNQVFAQTYQANIYNIANTTAFRYYRLNITANRGGSGYGIQLTELGLYAANPGTTLVPPAAPLDLSATWSSGQIALVWQATFAAASYNVKRATTSGGPYTTLATGLTSPNYADTTVTNGTPYYYVVSAVNAGGESLNSVENAATAYGIPAAPTGLAAAAGNTQVTLNWNAVSGASQYWVGRGTASGGPYADLGIIAATGYVDSGLTNGTTYYYVVAASNEGQLSANSSEANATPGPRLTGTVIGTAGSWNNTGNTRDKALDGSLTTFFDAPVTNGAWVGLDLGTTAVVNQVRYCPRANYASRMNGGKFQGSSAADFSSGVVDLFTVPPTPAYGVMTAATVTNTTAFRYVRYLGPDGSNGNVAEIEFDGTFSPPGAPQAVSATGGNSRVALSWASVPAATSYNVKRASAANGPFTTILRRTAGTSALDTGLANGATVYYVVNAVGTAGTGADSSPVGATPQMTYADYAQQYGLGDAAASNGNGVTNLAAYAFGHLRNGAAVAGLPAVGSDGTHLTITFNRRKAPTDVAYTVETSDDLVTWNSGPADTTEQPAVSLDGTFEQVTVQDNALMGASPTRFLRVRLTLPPR